MSSSLAISSAVSFLVAMVVAAAGCSADPVDEEEDVEATADPLQAPAAAGPIGFWNACIPGQKITIAAVGDVLLHKTLQEQSAGQGFHRLWSDVEPLLGQADVTYANLEGPCAERVLFSGREAPADPPGFDGNVYTAYPTFNYHKELIPALVESGVDVVSTANNHARDRNELGIDRTIDNLRASGLAFTGTRRSNEPDAPWVTVTHTSGVSIAWLACTFSTNGIPDPTNQVLSCYEDRATVIDTIRALKADPGVDAIIVTPHWGAEYSHAPRRQEKDLAHQMLDEGATAILGSHPHVVQPWEAYLTQDQRETFIIYSLGNFVSGQGTVPKQSSLILYLGLTKGEDGKVTVNGARYVPLQMRQNPYTVTWASGQHLALTTRVFGQWDRLEPGEPIVTNPRCL